MMKDWLELPHLDVDGYKVSAEYTFLVLNNKFERIPVRFKVELEWERDDRHEEDSYYHARLITSEGTVIHLEVDEDGEMPDSTGGDYFVESIFLPELRGQHVADGFDCGYFDFYLELAVSDSKGTVSLFPRLYQSIKYYPIV